MRFRRIIVALALASCWDGAGELSREDGGADVGGDAVSCEGIDLIAGIAVEGAAIPGRDLLLSVEDAGSGREVEVAWTVSSGALSAQTGASVTWTLHDLAAIHVAQTDTVTAVASSSGCEDDTVETDVLIDWPEALRTAVLYDPGVAGSLDVAEYYAEFRGIPADHLCGVAATNPTSIPAAEWDTWLSSAMTCIDGVGGHVQYVVPTWGVPYKVSGRVDDIGSGNPTTVSLDALLVFGRRGDELYAAIENPLYRPGDSRTAVHEDYQPIGPFRDEIVAEYFDQYFLVARIDGASAAAAMELVDRTAAAADLARMGMLDGTVYVDGNRGLPHPATDSFGSYESGEWNIIGVQTLFDGLGWYDVVSDYDGAEFGTAPAPLACPDALYYAGWYSFGNYNDVFTWATGAIGGHLDSCSACDLRGSVDWSALALQRGITATFGAVNEPYVAGMPEYDQFFKYLTDGASFGEAAYNSTIIGAWMMVWVGDPLYRPHPAAQ